MSEVLTNPIVPVPAVPRSGSAKVVATGAQPTITVVAVIVSVS